MHSLKAPAMHQSFIYRSSSIAIALLAAVLVNSKAHADDLPLCNQRLLVTLTHDVPNARDPQFLSSLIKGNPEYALYWVRQDDPTDIVLDLSGPGSATDCAAVIGLLRQDGRIESLQVEPETEVPSVSVESPAAPETGSHLSQAGLGSLVWAAHHPSSAWRVLAPVQPDDSSGPAIDPATVCAEEKAYSGESPICR
jgi:hypothetical protein